MVSLIIVAHSKEIAQGTLKLAEQMKQDDIEIIAVGGTKDGRIGTDPDAIADAINRVNKEDGVIVLTDLGSSIMNIKMVLEEIPAEERAKIYIASAPLVEGAVFGAVEASLGKDLKEVLRVIESPELLNKNE